MATWRDRLRRRLAELQAKDGRDDRAAVAERAGISVQAISNYLQGTREPRSLSDWERLASALRVRPSWLAFGDDSPDDMTAELSRRIRDLPPESRRALHTLLNHTA